MSVTVKDNSKQYLSELERAIRASLEAVGNQGVTYAKKNVDAAGRIDTSNMINSINHQVQDKTVYIGTNVKYALYNEMGTSIYVPGGRTSPWAYQDANGEWHRTRGMRPIHFLKNAIVEHIETLRQIIIDKLKGG